MAQSPPLGLDIPEGTSFEHWLALGKHLALTDNALAWRIGDWWVYGEHRYGDRIAAVRTRGWNGPSFGACRNYAMVARAFETSRRRDVLSFSHHREVASLSPAEADQLLDWAEEPRRNGGKPRSTRELRSQVRSRVAARRRLNGSSTRSTDITDATSTGQRKLERQEQTERLRRRALSFPTNLDDSVNVLPVPAELAAPRAEPCRLIKLPLLEPPLARLTTLETIFQSLTPRGSRDDGFLVRKTGFFGARWGEISR